MIVSLYVYIRNQDILMHKLKSIPALDVINTSSK